MGGDGVKRVPAEEARRKVQKGAALLVCAYEDETKCREMALEGGITPAELERRMTLFPADKGLIFYCA
ncbi:MAG: ArsR family transcriptional regulator [Candidatus Rokubacteria bacterium]|nr:ArsR family transcriptional regulator [Candidatus Rokubacteria bacterium]